MQGCALAETHGCDVCIGAGSILKQRNAGNFGPRDPGRSPHAARYSARRYDIARRYLAIVLSLTLGALRAVAQYDLSSDIPANSDTEAAATEERLWLVLNMADGAHLFSRSRGADFEPVNQLNSRVVHLAPSDDECVLFLADHTIYRQHLTDSTLSAVRNLPGAGVPMDVSAWHGKVYALINAATAAALRAGGAASAPTEPAHDADKHFALAVLEKDQWRFLADGPPELERANSGGLNARLLAVDDYILAMSVDHGQLRYSWYSLSDGSWSPSGRIGPREFTAFWLVRVAGTPTLILSSDSEAGAQFSAWRWLPDQHLGGFSFRPAEGHLTSLPERQKITGFDHAFGFNQHLGLVTRDEKTRIFLTFARFDSVPIEPTVSVGEAISRAGRIQQTQGYLQLATMAIIVVVMISLIGLRRGSLTSPLTLPPDTAPGLLIQRVIAGLIDFAPFAIAAARALNVPLSDAIQTLSKWTLQTDVMSPSVRPFMYWWLLSCGGFVLYSFLVELLSRRTVGKVFLGLRVANERGARPSILAVLLRNVMKFVELMPQFWVFAVMLVFSINRQRVGDIFARTLVVRRVPPADTGLRRPRRDTAVTPSDDDSATPT